MRAMLIPAVSEFTCPKNSSMSLGLFPAASILVGVLINFAILLSPSLKGYSLMEFFLPIPLQNQGEAC
jgi:hypothetical protein